HKNPTSFHFVQWKSDGRQTIPTLTTWFFDAIQEFDDLTLRIAITPYLADNRNLDLGVKVPRHLSSHSWSVADCPSKVLLVVTPKNKKARCQEASPSIDRGNPLPIRQLSDDYQKQSLLRCRFCGERCYHQDCPIEDVAGRTVTKMVTKKASAENLLRAVQRGRTRTIRER
ncbi:hypothetical protein ACTXT7_017430, partial [Hymenolepis weldensis]